jgi:hypothetical protein
MRTSWKCLALAAAVAVGCANSEGTDPLPDAGSTDLGTAPIDMPTPPVDMPMQQVNCGAVTNCGTCNSLGPCGWCGATNTCVAGNAMGPAVGACAGMWSHTPELCPAVDAGQPPVDTGTPAVDAGNPAVDAGTPGDVADPCAAATTCGGCTAMASCGFCQSTGRCQTGGRDAPTMGPACPSGWAWISSSCSAPDAGAVDAGDPCASATSCGACTQRSQCGWCPTLNRCLLGTSMGPNSTGGMCGTWAWYSGQCGGGDGGTDAGAVDAGDPCVSATNCSTCTARSQCGWCPGANRCAVGTSSGPTGTVPACGSWAWVSSACMPTDGGVADAGTSTDGGLTTGGVIPGFGDPGTFNPADVARACPAGGTLRLAITRIFATPRDPMGRAWDGIPGVTDFVCNTTSDRVRDTLRDQINGVRMGTGDTVDRIVGDRFRDVVATQCGAAGDWFLGRWEGPDMFAQMYNPAGAGSPVWRTSTEDNSWEAPRAGATWNNAYIDVPCNTLGVTQYRLSVRDEDLVGSEPMGEMNFRASELTPQAMCAGYAFRPGFAGVAGILFRVTVTGGTQNCTGLR